MLIWEVITESTPNTLTRLLQILCILIWVVYLCVSVSGLWCIVGTRRVIETLISLYRMSRSAPFVSTINFRKTLIATQYHRRVYYLVFISRFVLYMISFVSFSPFADLYEITQSNWCARLQTVVVSQARHLN